MKIPTGAIPSLLCASLAFFFVACGSETAPPATSNVHGLDLANFDTSVGPCVDFYQYANGGWLSRNPIPPEETGWGTGTEVRTRTFETLKAILEEASANTSAPEGSVAQKVGDFYASAMDTARIEELGADPISEDLARIEAFSSVSDVQGFVQDMHARGSAYLFQIGVEQDLMNSEVMLTYVLQGGLGLPEKDYYLREDEESVELRRKYVDHVASMFRLLGEDDAGSVRNAETVLSLETALAQASLGAVELRNPANFYRPVTLGQADGETPSFGWTSFFRSLGLAEVEVFSHPHTTFFEALEKELTGRPMEDWKSYFRWHLVNGAAPYLSSAFVEQDFDFYSRTLMGAEEQQPRWRRALAQTDAYLGEALGQLYVAEAFPPETKARALEMIGNVQSALQDRLRALEWMGEDTKAIALEKSETFTPKIGYPDEWRDYSSLHIDGDSYLGNIQRGSAFEMRRQLDKIGKPVDKKEWAMSPATVNAYYNPLRNEIVFPAGIMQPPFFDGEIDDAINYGAMGAIIGHEIMHGYDDLGSQFGPDGTMSGWWTPEDRAEFETRAAVLIEQYADYVVVDDLHVNGELTLGENIGDMGGLIISYYGLQKALEGKPREEIDGFTPEQRFFLSWAQAWRRNQRDESLRLQVQTDPHSPANFRTIGPLANLPEFADAFGCQAGDPMVRATEEQVRIW